VTVVVKFPLAWPTGSAQAGHADEPESPERLAESAESLQPIRAAEPAKPVPPLRCGFVFLGSEEFAFWQQPS